MTDPQIVSAEGYQQKFKRGTSPAQKMIEESTGNGLYSMRQVADILNVHIETVRRVCRRERADGTKVVKAPSKVLIKGGMHIWMLNDEDLEELAEYFNAKKQVQDHYKSRRASRDIR